jgi:hypothetical protein
MSSLEDATQKRIANLPETTGKSLAEWRKVVKASGLEKHGEIVKNLKSEHGLTHGHANFIALQVLKPEESASETSAEDPSAELYSGAKEGLRPIHDALMKIVQGFGDDVEVAAKKGYESLRRKKQFALIQPSTATRVDVGLILKGTEPTERLERSGSFNAMVTHRVRLEKKSDIDAELKRWLKQAYDAAG